MLEIIQKAKYGDDDALIELYNYFHPQIMKDLEVLNVTLPTIIKEQLIEDSFKNIQNIVQQYEPELGSFEPFLNYASVPV